MYNIGDLVIYSAHGICKIDDICEKTFSDITRTYYVLHPLEGHQQLSISIPVDNEKVVILDLIHQEEANEILESFKKPGIAWNDKPNLRYSLYSGVVNTGDRRQIAKVVNTLMRKKIEVELLDRKLYEQDRRLLNNTQNILFKELALSMNSSIKEINDRVIGFMMKNK